MKRQTNIQQLAVSTSDLESRPYELEVSPRNSIESDFVPVDIDTKHDPSSSSSPTPAAPSSSPSSAPSLQPSLKLLFSLLSRRHVCLLLIPAIFSSLVSGGIAPFMTFVIGQAFDAFATYPNSPASPDFPPTKEAKDALLRGVGLAALQLLGLAVGSIALGSVTSSLWIWTGEVNVRALRRMVFRSMMNKEMSWFDSNMGTSSNEAADENSNGPVGAAGHMAKFQRETDEVRSASSLASGLLVQSITTTIACLILAFMRSWALTLVILSAVPLLIFIQGLSQGFANPLLAYEREQTAIAATIVDRAVAAISTVKAFNAQSFEVRRAKAAFSSLTKAAGKLNALWATTSGLSQFVMFAMFVQGFWFGAKLVRDGRVSAGDVMAVFWACLIATTNLQMCIPHLITLAKGKFAMVAMLSLVDDFSSPSESSSSKPAYRRSTASSVDTPPSPTTRSSQFGFLQSFKPTTSSSPRTLRKITPSKCHGELALHNITFAYPSRPSIPVLSNVSLFLPAHEMTFIVGSSGSGKSSVGALLMRMYDPQEGMVTLDERDVRFLEEEWVRGHVGAVQQGGCVLLDGRSVFENVVAGLGMDLEGLYDIISGEGEDGEKMMREEVEEACRAALMHDFVRDMPQGYDTVLGGGSGVGLSGGQKQRLAIARAKLRNPTVLILDEATSALDSTSRILVFEALKRWRSNKTTIVITHDLSQISPNDFVYVLKQGRVAEQGYRYDLEMVFGGEDEDRGEFRKMMDVQAQMGGFLPEKDIDLLAPSPAPEDVEDLYDEEEDAVVVNPANLKHQSLAIRPLTFGNWMFDVIADLTAKPLAVPAPVVVNNRPSQYRISRFVPFEAFVGSNAIDEEKPQPEGRQRRPSSIHLEMPASPVAARFSLTPSKRYSLPFTPTSATFTIASSNPFATYPSEKKYVEEEEDEEEKAFNNEKYAVEMSGATARKGREARELQMQRRGWQSTAELSSVAIQPRFNTPHPGDEEEPRPSFLGLSRVAFSTLPSKPILFIGLTFCLLSGAMTPLFSFLLSRLLFEVSIGARNVSVINMFGGIVLGVAALDGLFLALKYAIMEGVANGWAERVRGDAFGGVVRQDRKWFDASPAAASSASTNEKVASSSSTDISITETPKAKQESSATIDNTPARIVQIIVKDADDARNLISIVWAQCIVVTAMLSVGLLWALIRGWELTLAGFAIAPVFAGVMAVQSRLVAKCEVRNKRAREEVSRGYYEAIVNVRGIRSMALGGIFEAQFERAAKRALKTGVRGAFVEGCTYGVASGLIYFAEALLFYVGAVLIVRGRYSYLQMVEVLNLVVFTVTIGSQLMAFTEKIAKSTQATSDLHKLMNLPTSTDESKGSLKPTINGSIQFNDVTFTYPERPTAPVLKSIDLSINAGEWVAIVGPSGSGKSTITALLQRLYEPSSGRITIDGIPLSDIQTSHLREQVSVVSQSPNLFDASVEENIRYGSYGVTPTDVRKAAKKAMVHEFVMGLPMGYDTALGENAALVSGGQAQRLQIARALARPSRVLILDECTSALDPENQALVMESIRSAAAGEGEEGGKRTTVMVTHKMEVMQMCDRIVVVQDGEIVEEGRFEELVRRKGVFATLASGGEWVG